MDLDWYLQNIELLRHAYPCSDVQYDTQQLTWILIDPIDLPKTLQPEATILLLTLLGISPSNAMPLVGWYIGCNVSRKDGRRIPHLYVDHSYNNLRGKDYARYSFHPQNWRPNRIVLEGDNFLFLIQTFLDTIEDDV